MGEIKEKRPDDEKSQKEWISHLVTNLKIEALGTIDMGGSAEGIREKLITDLRSNAKGSLIEEVVSLVEQHSWETRKDVEDFNERYLEFDERLSKGA